MPLPTTDMQWPPPQFAAITYKHREWDAWYMGDPQRLRGVYQHASSPGARPRPSQYAGGVVGAAARFWWGKPTPQAGATSREQLHIPLARDIAITSADLLYADPPEITTGNTATDKRISDYTDDGWHNELAAGAEIGAALGARFMRVTWDKQITDRPFLTTIHADDAIPEFRFGRLTALTVTTVVREDNQMVWRWLERHELDTQGNGLILHGLYQGTPTHLGRPVPLQDDPATAHLAHLVGSDGAIIEGRTPGLAVIHVANRTPSPEWRKHQTGRHLGTSDFSSVTGLMDSLDETWSSWMRDIRVGKARILASEALFETDQTGRVFDYDREVFELVNVLPGETDAMPIRQVQFNLRVQEHAATADALTKKIIEQSGYSLQSFGDMVMDADITATEVRAREKKSMATRDRKIRHERPALQALTQKMLLTDHAVFNTRGLTPDAVTVTFPDAVQESPEAIARTVSMLRSARVISIETGVKLAHPDWEDATIAEEVARIVGEDMMADPLTTVPTDATA